MSVPAYFVPSRKIIYDILKDKRRTFFLFSNPHNYFSGLVVKILVPQSRGMIQLDNYVGSINVISSLAFYILLDSSNFDPFNTYISENEEKEHAQVVPIGVYKNSLEGAVHNSGIMNPEF